MSTRPVSTVYYENWIQKKEGVKTWISYWTVIRGKWLQFYERKSEEDKPELRKTLELPTKTRCSLVKRRKNRFPFSVNNGMGIYYMKCDTELERYHWIFSILTAALGRPKKDLPVTVPQSMVEKEAFKKIPNVELKNGQENMSPSKSSSSSMSSSPSKTSPTKRPTSATDIHNKRRQKYAIRNEQRAKRKAAKRAKKYGLPTEDENPSGETSLQMLQKMKTKDAVSSLEKSIDALKRTKNVRVRENNDLRRQQSLDFLEEKIKDRKTYAASVPDLTKNIEKDFNIKNSSKSQGRPQSRTTDVRSQPKQSRHQLNKHKSPERSGSIQVEVMMNPKQRRSELGDSNLAYEIDEDIEIYPHLPVKLDDDQLLPNMIVTEISDSESDGTESTVETSINSDTNSFLSLSAMSSYTSRTIISTDENGNYEQHDRRGSLISSPDINRRNVALNNRTNTRPRSPGIQSKVKQKNLIDRPVTPVYDRPLTPNRSAADFSRFLIGSTHA